MRIVTLGVLLLLSAFCGLAAAGPEGTLTWGVHVTLATRWLDPSDTEAFMLDRKKREAMLHQIQQVMYDRVLHIPICELAFLWGVGPRVEEACVDHIKGFAYSAPYEDLKLKAAR